MYVHCVYTYVCVCIVSACLVICPGISLALTDVAVLYIVVYLFVIQCNVCPTTHYVIRSCILAFYTAYMHMYPDW